MPFNVLATAQARPFAHGQVKLVYGSATQVVLTYAAGDLIKINGLWRRLPVGGITITNAGLAASTQYFCYAYWTGTTVALEFSATARATSTTAGNEGVMVKSGDDTRTLVGMVRTDASSQFQDAPAFRGVRSWLNDYGVTGWAYGSGAVSTGSTAWIELDAAARAFVLLWAGEQFNLIVQSAAYNAAASNTQYLIPYVNGATYGGYSYTTEAPSAAGFWQGVSASASGVSGSDSLSTFSMGGQVNAGTGTWGTKMTTVTSVRK